MAKKGFLRDLDGDFIGTGAGQLRLGDPGQGDDLVPNLLGDPLEGPFIRGSRDGHVDDLVADDDLLDHRLLGLLRKGADGVHPGLDLVHQIPDFGPLQHLHVHDTHALGGGGRDPLHSGKALNGLLDPDADPLLDLLRRRARIENRNADQFGGEFGEDLLPDFGYGESTADQNHDHQQIGHDPVGCEPGDESLHGDASRPESG